MTGRTPDGAGSRACNSTEINTYDAALQGRPRVDLLDAEEEARIPDAHTARGQ